jgi:uncharacterized membrane protein
MPDPLADGDAPPPDDQIGSVKNALANRDEARANAERGEDALGARADIARRHANRRPSTVLTTNRKGAPTMRSIRTMACYAVVIAFALLVMPTGALALTFTFVDVLGAEAAGINPQGDIVGFYIDGTANHGFLLDKEGILTTIDVPGASITRARGISPQGDIVGFYIVGSTSHSFLLHEGRVTIIDVPGASFTRARAISPQGDIVGFYGVAGGATHGYLLDKEGTFTTIDVPGASLTQAFGINPRGDVVGSYAAGGATHGFLLDKKGTFTTIDVPGASFTEALGVNPRGDIVGRYSAGGAFHGFLAQ